MTTRDALLAAIAENPEDDTARLVYADFLDETGGPTDTARAKLIRIQIAGSRLPADSGERAELDKVADGLWERYKSAWFPGIESSKLPYPERGFIGSWGCYSAAEVASVEAVPFAQEPITALTLSVGRAAELAGAERWQGLGRVRELNVWPGKTDDAGMAQFLSSPHLNGLRKLWIMGNRARPWSPMPESIHLLATLPQYASLRELTIEHAEVGNAGAVALAGSTTLRDLTSLSLGQCEVGVEGLRTLLASPVMSHVAHLGLGGIARSASDGETLATILGRSDYLGHLETLGLDETAFTDRAAALLAAAKWPALRRLTILPHAQNHSDEETGLPTMTATGIENLIAASWAAGLEWLNLSGQLFGDSGAVALTRGNRMAHLRGLTLMGTGFTAVGLQALTEAYSQQLELFQLAYNPIGDAGAVVIADATWPKMIPAPPGVGYEQRGLFMARCGIGEVGAKALARATAIPREIPDLFLGDAEVSTAVIARIRARYPNATVQFS